MKSQEEIQNMLVHTLESIIEAVKTNDEFMFILNKQRADALAEVLELNVYARDFIKDKVAHIAAQNGLNEH